MSSSGEVALQRRPPTSHTNQGERHTGVYHRTRQTETQPCPNKDVLPLTESKPMTFRPEVHVHHDHRSSVYDKRSKPGVPRGQTKVIGRPNQTGFKTPRETSKTRRQVNKANRWLAKYN